MKELEKLLNKNNIVIPMTLTEMLVQMKVWLDGIKLQEFKISMLQDKIDNSEYNDVYLDDMEQEQEMQEGTLRGLKNQFRMQEAAFHEAMKTTDEV